MKNYIIRYCHGGVVVGAPVVVTRRIVVVVVGRDALRKTTRRSSRVARWQDVLFDCTCPTPLRQCRTCSPPTHTGDGRFVVVRWFSNQMANNIDKTHTVGTH